MGDTGILGVNHPGLHLLDPVKKNFLMGATPLSPEFPFELSRRVPEVQKTAWKGIFLGVCDP